MCSELPRVCATHSTCTFCELETFWFYYLPLGDSLVLSTKFLLEHPMRHAEQTAASTILEKYGPAGAAVAVRAGVIDKPVA